MKIIQFEKIWELGISPAECVNWVENAFRIKYSSYLPPKISLKLPENVFFNTMPCYIPSLKRIGIKVVSRYPNRNPALSSDLLLFNSDNGNCLALMDGNWITAMRTGAVAASAANHFQKSNASKYSFIGLGNTARATLLCLAASNPGKAFKVKLLAYKDQADLFMNRFESYTNIEFSIVLNSRDLIERADVVLSCVTAANDIVGEDEWYKEGVLVIPVHTRGFQNCDLFFDKVFVDDIGHVKNFKYFDKFKSCEEFSKVLLKEIPGRQNDKERILAYNIGIALHDTFFASEIFNKLAETSPEIDINDSNLSKFWV